MKAGHGVLAFLIVVGSALTELEAQQGAIRGSVKSDQDEKPLEGVEVAIAAGGGARRVTVTTNEQGSFVRPGLQPGTYTIDFSLDGYEPFYAQVTISSGQAYRMDAVVLVKEPEGLLDEEAHEKATRALEAASKATEAGDHQGALDALLELSEIIPDVPATVLFNIGRSYESLGQAEQAVAYYEKTVEREPLYDAYVAMAQIHSASSHWELAKTALEKALEVKPGDPVVLFNYGAYAMNSGDSATAEVVFGELVENNPQDALAHYQLGMVKASLGKNEDAVGLMTRYLELDPEGAYADTARQVLETLSKS